MGLLFFSPTDDDCQAGFDRCGLKPEQRFIYGGSMVILPIFWHRVLLGSCIDYSGIGQRATVNAPA